MSRLRYAALPLLLTVALTGCSEEAQNAVEGARSAVSPSAAPVETPPAPSPASSEPGSTLPSLSPEDQERLNEAAETAKQVATRTGCISFVTGTAARYATRAGEAAREETLENARLTLGVENSAYQALLEVTSAQSLLDAAVSGGVIAATVEARRLASEACPKE